MKTWENATDLVGRALIAAMFLLAGIGKISGYAGTQAYMQSMGVPGALLPLVIALEVLGSIVILAGYRPRPQVLRGDCPQAVPLSESFGRPGWARNRVRARGHGAGTGC